MSQSICGLLAANIFFFLLWGRAAEVKPEESKEGFNLFNEEFEMLKLVLES